MAATALASHNSASSQSDKKRDFVSRSAVAELLDTADFSRDLEAIIVKRAGREKGHRTYRRRHLVAALKGIWRASSSPYGTGEILCYASVEGYAIEAGVSERALRYNLRELERIGVIELVYAANTIRRPATYRLNLHKLRPRRTYEQLKQSRPPRRALHSVHHSSPRPSPAAQEAVQEAASVATSPLKPADAAPVAGSVAVAPAHDSHRSSERPTRRLTSREGPKLVAKMAELMKGHTRHVGIDGYGFDLDPGDPRYRAPMAQEKALICACMTLCIPEESAKEALKLAGWNFDKEEALAIYPELPSAPPNKAEQRRDSNLRANQRMKERLRERFGKSDEEAEPSP